MKSGGDRSSALPVCAIVLPRQQEMHRQIPALHQSTCPSLPPSARDPFFQKFYPHFAPLDRTRELHFSQRTQMCADQVADFRENRDRDDYCSLAEFSKVETRSYHLGPPWRRVARYRPGSASPFTPSGSGAPSNSLACSAISFRPLRPIPKKEGRVPLAKRRPANSSKAVLIVAERLTRSFRAISCNASNNDSSAKIVVLFMPILPYACMLSNIEYIIKLRRDGFKVRVCISRPALLSMIPWLRGRYEDSPDRLR